MFDTHRDHGDENDFKDINARGRLTADVVLGHPGLSAAINENIFSSAISGGAKPSKLPATAKGYKITTLNRTYTLLRTAEGGWTIQGHPRYCPTPVACNIHGSTWGGSMLKMDFIGRGMHLEVGLIRPGGRAAVMTTSPISEVEEIKS